MMNNIGMLLVSRKLSKFWNWLVGKNVQTYVTQRICIKKCLLEGHFQGLEKLI